MVHLEHVKLPQFRYQCIISAVTHAARPWLTVYVLNRRQVNRPTRSGAILTPPLLMSRGPDATLRANRRVTRVITAQPSFTSNLFCNLSPLPQLRNWPARHFLPKVPWDLTTAASQLHSLTRAASKGHGVRRRSLWRRWQLAAETIVSPAHCTFTTTYRLIN